MTHPILSRIPILKQYIDERFLEHRRRSSSIAGFATIIMAACVFEYRIFVNHVIDWEMGAVVLAFALVKTSMFIWYRFSD